MRGRRDRSLPAILVLSLATLAAVAAVAREDHYYAGNEARIALDEEAPAQSFDFQPTFGFVGPERRARCSVYAGTADVPVTASASFLDILGDQGEPMPTEQISRTTEEDGWTEPFLMESPAPGETLALLWNAALGGDSAVAEAFTQCSFGRPRQCVPAGDTACISVGGKERFEARLVSRDAGEDSPEPAPVDTVTDDGAVFLLPPSNTEVAIQVIDACSQEGLNAFVVSFEPAADLDLTLYVTDTETGVINRYDEATTSAGTILDAPDFDTCP